MRRSRLLRRRWIGLTTAVVLLSTASVAPAQVQPLRDRWLQRFSGVANDSPATRPAAAYENAADVMLRLAEHGQFWPALSMADAAAKADKAKARLAQAIALNDLGEHRAALVAAGSAPGVRGTIEAARARWGMQEHEAAIKELAAAGSEPSAALQAALWLIELGRPDEAAGMLEKVSLGADGSPLVMAADQDPRWNNAAWATTVCRTTDVWAGLTGAYGSRPGLQQAVYGRLVKTFDTIDRSYLPARVAAAEFALQRDDPAKAEEDIKAALAQAPADREALRVLGEVLLASSDIDRVMTLARRLQVDNPRDEVARFLAARVWMTLGQPEAALAAAGLTTTSKPVLAWQAGLICGALGNMGRDAEARAGLEDWLAAHPKDGSAAGLAGHWLVGGRRFELAGWAFGEATRREPNAAQWLAESATRHIMLGEYGPAGAALERAFALDPYDTSAANFRAILKVIRGMPVVQTEAIELRHDAGIPEPVARLMAEYAQSVHARLAQRYGVSPPGRVFIEVYGTAKQFAVRTTGTTFIPTVGASTGPCIAMVVPKPGAQTSGAFDWAQVIRHEMTHTFTLHASRQRVSRWMTEGLAVCAEDAPIPWEWVPLLADAVKRDRLIPMGRLDWMFIRPPEPSGRALAYAQSHWLCRFAMEKNGTNGDGVPRRLIELLARDDGVTPEDALVRVCGEGMTAATVRREFGEWCRKQVAGWGMGGSEAAAAEFDALKDEGEKQIESGDLTGALATWQKAATLRPMDPLPQQRLAGLYLAKGINRPKEAIAPLWRLAEADRTSNRYARRIARVALDASDLPQARKAAERAVEQGLFDVNAHRLLMDVAEKQGDSALVARQKAIVEALSAEPATEPAP